MRIHTTPGNKYTMLLCGINKKVKANKFNIFAFYNMITTIVTNRLTT